MVKLMVHMFLVASMAQDEICTSKSCASDQLNLIQADRFRSGLQPVQNHSQSCPEPDTSHSQVSLGCSIKEDLDETAIQLGAKLGHKLRYGCLELKSLCNGVPDNLGGEKTLALIQKTCPQTCGVPCEAKCCPVHQCDWGMLTSVAQKEGCDVVTCRKMTKQETMACPWLVEEPTEKSFQCGDDTTCDGKDCCNDKKGRVKCPSTHPYMCNEPCPFCDPEGVSFSCQKTTCNANGGYRTCLWTNNGKGPSARIKAAKTMEKKARERWQTKRQTKKTLANTAADGGDAELPGRPWRPATDDAF